MHDLSLYEKKIINDEEYPVQSFFNRIRKPGQYCPPHWHEHIEIHYILDGEGIFYVNRNPFPVSKGSLFIINSNELHEGFSHTMVFDALVLIFEMDAFSKEVANFNVLFQTHIQSDEIIMELMDVICREELERGIGYKLAMKGKVYEMISYLLRKYVVRSMSDKENSRRLQKLDRLNMVLQYIQNNYTEQIKVNTLAELIHISEYRFCHLFKESMGQSPLNYINEVRLKKAHHLLEQKDMSISEIASVVGFQDYNNFGRLFRKYYGYSPSSLWS